MSTIFVLIVYLMFLNCDTWLGQCQIIPMWLHGHTSLSKAPWKLNPFWLNLFPDKTSITSHIKAYFQVHPDFRDPPFVWMLLKYSLWGLFISEMKAVQN